MEPSQLRGLSWPTPVSEGREPSGSLGRALPCSGEVGAGLAVQSVAVTSTAQKRRHFQLHIPVLRLEVGDQAPHLHGDAAVGLILVGELTLGRGKKKKKKTINKPKLGGSAIGREARGKRGKVSLMGILSTRVPETRMYSFWHKEGNCGLAPRLNFRFTGLA